MKPAYYNEIDPYCCEWLRNLIAAGHIPAGEVDQRDIREVSADDLVGFGQCHFFAGIGGFAYASRLAGWPDDRPIWTGGFPCQPFSLAGIQKGIEDDRYLWPQLSRLITSGRPPFFIGENVTGIIPMALDRVHLDLETAGYASRSFVIPACAVNAPHRRERVWIVAYTNSIRWEKWQRVQQNEREKFKAVAGSGHVADANSQSSFWTTEPWSESDHRRIKPGIRLLADGIPCRVDQLRAFGNAIVPQVAAEIIQAMM